jgi:hypothetical protein
MSDTRSSTLTFEPIPAAELARIRAAGADEAGNPLAPVTDAEGGAPLRCCLRESRPGEQMALVAYTPPGPAGPYAERGPVFIHARECAGYPAPGQYPPGLAHRQQVVRAYDDAGRIAAGVLAEDGARALEVIRDLLGQPGIALVQLRNAGFGCYNCTVRRG